MPTPEVVFTIGHSTHEMDAFTKLLSTHGIHQVIDVRTYPGSRRHPQYGRERMALWLPENGVAYRHLALLGGRRHDVDPESPNDGWTHPAFRSYADYAMGQEFRAGLAELTDVAGHKRTAFMCSEGLWWKCHRRIISDHLAALGHNVVHIMPNGAASTHALTPFARPGDPLTYPQPDTGT